MKNIQMPPSRGAHATIDNMCLNYHEPGGLELDFEADGLFTCSDPTYFTPLLLPGLHVNNDKIKSLTPTKTGTVDIGFTYFRNGAFGIYGVHLTIANPCT